MPKYTRDDPMYGSLKIQGLNIVLVGQFNPTIFQPRWFSVNKLIGEHEAEDAQIKIIHSDITIFSTDWFSLSVDRQRFQISTIQEPHFEPLRDLVIGTFRLLCYTPLSKMGINLSFRFELQSFQKLGILFNCLTPTQDWEAVLRNPQMQTLVIRGYRPDSHSGYVGVSVEPSTKVLCGVYIEVNDHYELEDPSNLELVSQRMISLLDECWIDSLKRSQSIAENVIGRVHKNEDNR